MRHVLTNLLLVVLLLAGGRHLAGLPEGGAPRPGARAEVRGRTAAAPEALGALRPVETELRAALPPSSAMQQPRQLRTVSQNAPSRHGPRPVPGLSSPHRAAPAHAPCLTPGGRHAARIPRVRSRLARWYYVLALRRILC